MHTRQDRTERGLNVLVVEDETILSIDLEIMLENMGHRIAGVAPHRERALKLIDRLGGRIDCVLLDTRLALQSSQPVAERLKRAHIPYVMMSGDAGSDLRRRGSEGPWIDKPLRPRQIQRALEEVAAQ